jgi:hypothetical protein
VVGLAGVAFIFLIASQLFGRAAVVCAAVHRDAGDAERAQRHFDAAERLRAR